MGTSILKIELKIMSGEKRELPIIRVRLVKRRRREVKVDPKLGGQRNVPMLGGQWNVTSLVANGRRRKRFFFTSFHFPPKQFYLDLCFFPLILRFYFAMVISHYLHISSFFLGLQITIAYFDVTNPPHIHCRFNLVEDFFLEIMALCMATFYGLQVTQVNEKPALKSSLDLTLMQHLHDEDPALRKVHARLEVDPPRTWYNRISLNSCTLVILL